MHAGKILFAQLMDLLPLHEFHKCVRRYNGDYRVIYRIEHNEIVIIKIGHRREIYDHPLS